ncbi:histidine phosphatase family protein [Prevotella sp. E15-22]|uniref:histidine phosphatase family protein n=1 Tax=Prevotella sp. E15-22 TaxID=2937774 RepID=UPI00204852D8|nr:histidine phosphatase family protein [Prevotella sp. E15-22]UPS45219.1 histidine phosphatase family protein [Prevotella sp. E15-22]
MTTLYLARHGETYDNERQIMQGQTPGELNDNGICQAEELSLQLADAPFDAVVASDLWRSVQTARIVAQPHALEVVTTPLLRERDWGSFTGRFIPDLKDIKPWPDDIESLEAMKARAGRFLDFIRTTYPNQTVLAVGHGIINKAIQAVFFHKEMHEIEKMKNAEVRVLDISL